MRKPSALQLLDAPVKSVKELRSLLSDALDIIDLQTVTIDAQRETINSQCALIRKLQEKSGVPDPDMVN